MARSGAAEPTRRGTMEPMRAAGKLGLAGALLVTWAVFVPGLGLGAAGPPLPLENAAPPSAKLSSTKAGAHNVTLTIQFPALLRCGRPIGTEVVTLPAAAPAPKAMALSAVRLNKLAPTSVVVKGHAITIALVPHGILCDSISEGTATIVFSGAAGIGNPSKPGTFMILVKHGAATYRAARQDHFRVEPRRGPPGDPGRAPRRKRGCYIPTCPRISPFRFFFVWMFT